MTEVNQPSENQQTDVESLELKLPDEATSWKDHGLWAGALVLLTLIAYWPATTGSFLWHDERVAENNFLLSPAGISHIWFDRWQKPDQFKQPVYQPVADTACWLEYRLGGHTDQGLPAPTAYHVASLLFHAAAAVLLWLVLRELLLPGAWWIAALFALHPLHAEDIAWISAQSVVLSGMFFLGSIYLYLMFLGSLDKDTANRATGGAGVDPAQTWGFYAGSAACGLLALLSDPSTIVLPLVVLLLLWWKQRARSRDVLLQLPLLIIGAVLWFTDLDLHPRDAGWLARLEIIGQGLGFSLLKLFVPLGQSIIYPAQPTIVGLVIFILAIGALIFLWVASRGFFVGLAMFCILVCFSVNWFDASRLSSVTDSTAYLAIVPLIAMIIALVRRVKFPGPHPQTVVALSAVLLLALGSLSWLRTHWFDNSVVLWRDVLRKDPASILAETSLAEDLRLQAIDDTAQGDTDAVKPALDEAITHAQAVLNRNPANASAQRTWADVLVAQGDNAAAASHFESAILLDPTNPNLRSEYAEALIKVGRYQPAIPQLNEALKWDVNSSTIHRLLGQAYSGIGNTDRAIKEQQLAVGIDPADFIAREKLAELQAKSGNYRQAIENYAKILSDSTQQKRPELWVAIAKIKDQQGAYTPAVEYLEAAVKLAPDDADIAKLMEVEQAKKKKQAATQPATTQTAK